MDKKPFSRLDHFAALAMQALIAFNHSQNGTEAVTITDIALDAYRYADKMIIVRELKTVEGVKEVLHG